jgi:pimeloyl-ACP methyl ester carboxylesterase
MANPGYLLYSSIIDDDGEQFVPVTLTSTEDQREKIVLAKPCVIPVLFLPGIMGTNLRKKEGKDIAWRPPNTDLRGAADAICQLFNYLFKNAKDRANDLATATVEVDPTGPIDSGRSALPRNVLVARGWGALMRSSYHPFMGELQHHLNSLAEFDFERCVADLKGWATEDGQSPPSDWGADRGDALTREEILHAANYQFDVWAGGYNWLQSNRDSGAAIKDLIEKTILPFYNEGRTVVAEDTPDGEGGNHCCIRRRKPGRPIAEKVIVVTHSMGGLVSRALTEIHACDKVLGVSHGVQPATGAPATYKRMRAGFEGMEQVVLGRNAAEVVAVLSQAPGGLELLPTADYNDGQPWLKVRERKGVKETLALPKHGDPYSEIYLSRAWYGLVPDRNLGMLSPAGPNIGTSPSSSYMSNRESPRYIMNEIIDRVREFHEAIKEQYKAPTYAYYGAQGQRNTEKERGGLLNSGLLASADRFSWGEVAWEGTGVGAFDPETGRITGDSGNGMLRTSEGLSLTLSTPDCPGDGTVPVHSGAAPAKAGIEMSFAHGQDCPGQQNKHFCYDHQDSYGDKRALYATMYAIVKIAHQAQWHKKESA